MSKAKQQKQRERQLELLKNFEGDFYQEKEVWNEIKKEKEWHIKMWNGGTQKWQVAVFSEKSYKNYKGYSGGNEPITKVELGQPVTVDDIRKLVEDRE